MNKLPDYTAEQMHYIDSVDGNAHITAVAIIGVLESQINTIRAKLTTQTARADALQAQLDALMLEYCPDEITPDQWEEWSKHQKQTPEDKP